MTTDRPVAVSGPVVSGPVVSGPVVSGPDVHPALRNESLVPPPRAQSVGTGACAELRDSMARFSSGHDHRVRRAAVDALIDRVDLGVVHHAARSVTEQRLGDGPVDVVEAVAFVVPTAALLTGLTEAGVLDVELSAADVLARLVRVVSVIGRGAPCTDADDEACPELLSMVERGHRAMSTADVVAVASLLYQNHDATAALIIERVWALATAIPRRSAVRKTLRMATVDVEVGGQVLPSGTVVTVDLESADPANGSGTECGAEFGSGPHRCPGRDLSMAIADGVLIALESTEFALLSDPGAFDANNRPVQLLFGRPAVGSS